MARCESIFSDERREISVNCLCAALCTPATHIQFHPSWLLLLNRLLCIFGTWWIIVWHVANGSPPTPVQVSDLRQRREKRWHHWLLMLSWVDALDLQKFLGASQVTSTITSMGTSAAEEPDVDLRDYYYMKLKPKHSEAHGVFCQRCRWASWQKLEKVSQIISRDCRSFHCNRCHRKGIVCHEWRSMAWFSAAE